MIGRFALYAAFVAALSVARIGAAQGNGGEVGMRGPRFLIASGNVPLDVTRAPALARRLSLQLNGVTRKQALAEISRQAGLKLVYGDNMLSLDERVKLRADSITVAAALTDVLWDAGLDVVLSTNNQAALVRRPKGVALPHAGALTGRITDANTGQNVVGAEVFLNDSRWRTVSDTAGRYYLSGIDTGSYTLTARKVGHGKQIRKVTVRADRVDTIDVALARVALTLDELVTTATGQQRRRDLGNAITTINADSVMQAAPIRNLTDLLEDRVPGLTVQHTSGAPGDPARLRLRGISSAMRGNDPVVIVDGVRIYSTQSEQRSGNLTNLKSGVAVPNTQTCQTLGCPGAGLRDLSGAVPVPSPLDQIDPNIIEKIEVFKGPSAATLYGPDAANGVIVVTTKKGRPGPARWSANVTHGITNTPGRWPDGYYRWGHIPEQGSGVRFCTIIDPFCHQDSLVRFQAMNDPKLTVLGQGRRTQLSLGTSGGSQSLTYSITGTYANETGLLMLPEFEVERFRTTFGRDAPDWMQRPHRLENWSVTSNMTALLGATADVSLRASLARTDQQRSNLETQIRRLAAVYVDQVNGVYYTPSGTIGSSVVTSDRFIGDHYQRTTASQLNFTTGLSATWRPRAWFNASAQAGVNVIPREDETLQPSGLVKLDDNGAMILGVGRSLVSTLNLQGVVRKPLGWGFNFETSVGTNLQTTATTDLVSSARGLQPGTSTLAGAATIDAIESRVNTSMFGWYIEPRITGQRISLSTGIRLDGGSSHGARLTQTGGSLLSLPKLNGSWVISEEPFFPFKSLFSSLRLRGAYGQAQVQPGPTDRLRVYTPVQFLQSNYGLTSVGNSDLLPERSTEFEGGFDADLVDSRLSLEFTAYRKTQVDAHMPVRLPPSLNGGGTVIRISATSAIRDWKLCLDSPQYKHQS